MESMVYPNLQADIWDRIKTAAYLCRISKFEEMLSDSFESMDSSDSLEYLGGYNKSDIAF